MSVQFAVSLKEAAVKAFLAAGRGDDASRAVVPRIVVEVHYEELLGAVDDKPADGRHRPVTRSVRLELPGVGSVGAELGDPARDELAVTLLRSDGGAARSHLVQVRDARADYAVSADDLQAVFDAEPGAPAPTLFQAERNAQLVSIGAVRPSFARSRLAVLGVQSARSLDAGEPLGSLGFDAARSSSVELDEAMAKGLLGLQWTSVHVGVDGRFSAAFELPLAAAAARPATHVGWAWWLTGERSLAGFVKDDLARPTRTPILVPLPALQPLPDDAAAGSGEGADPMRKVPADVTEAELVNNPGYYTEDPGAFCKPFSNPERVLSEKAFAVISRVEQPEIGPAASSRLRSQHLLDLEPAAKVQFKTSANRTDVQVMAAPTKDVLLSAMLDSRRPVRFTEPTEVFEDRRQMPSGRTLVSSEHPVQWEDDIAQYQSATVALGHILEFRVRTRSNGYSLGNVASTLTLAPRQTKRIQKVEFERVDRARREERQQLSDRVDEEVTRERDYNDTVAAYLSEWATGSSSSGTSAAAGGIGFAIPPIIGGVGGGTSKAWSESSQEGSRHTGASEQQRLRDAIRRHGDALRRLQSTVVTEITQLESVTGTTEVLRNPNYGHSLTVIYYQILRHMKVSTEFAGVRECLFVPFAIKPFTMQRAYRWREAIQRYLRVPRFAKAMRHLRDVVTGFEYSNLLPGARASQPLTYLRGSLYLTLAVERPRDTAKGEFDAAVWSTFSPFLGAPAYAIWARMASQSEAQRDQGFQRDDAPTFAAKWLDKLVIRAGGVNLQADCTLATRYGFNRTVRVDFNVPASRAGVFTRDQLHEVKVTARSGLPPGSVATVSRMSLRYGTANFERTIEAQSGTDDLLRPETADADAEGALLSFPLDDWDNVDERKLLTHGVNELVEHLNEHVEFYHKAVWWSMDRDRLHMMLDGFYVPGADRVSIASVVDREPLAIIGNSLVYRVGAGAFVGHGKIASPADLYNLYAAREPAQDPLLISVPTDGLYAQTIMDDCLALEEHRGSLDWVLDDPDPELGAIDPSLLASRRADGAAALAPTSLPATLINLPNAPDAPAPAGIADVLAAATNAGAFRDMAGLAGTQANAISALQTAAGLATNFGNQAAALKMAEMANKAKATQDVERQLAAVEKAKVRGLVTDSEATAHADKILAQLHTPGSGERNIVSGESLAQDLIGSGRGGSIAESSHSGVRVLDVLPAKFASFASTAQQQQSRDATVIDSIERELALSFSDPDDPGLHERRLRLRKLFASVAKDAAPALYERLGDDPTGDALSRQFHFRLATATRRELLDILRARIETPALAEPPPVQPTPLPVNAATPLPASAQDRFDAALFQLRIEVDRSTSLTAATRRTLACWFEKLQRADVDDRVIRWSMICPSTSGAIGAAAIVGPCELRGSRPSQEEIEAAFDSAAEVEAGGDGIGLFTYEKTAIVVAAEMTSMALANLLRDKAETFDAVNKLHAWANNPSGGSSAMPAAYRAIKDWLAERQDDGNSLYSCR